MLLHCESNFNAVVKSSKLINALAFLLPILMLVKIKLIGYLFLGELLVLILLPFLFKYCLVGFYRGHLRVFFLLFLFWTLSLVITDIMRNTSFENFSRGWAKQIFLAANFLFFYAIFKVNQRRISSVLFGLGFFYIYHSYRVFSDFPQIWKFGAGSGVALIILLLLSNMKAFKGGWSYVLCNSLVLLGLSVCSFILNSRSLAGIFVASAVAYFVLTRKTKRQDSVFKRKSVFGIVFLCLTLSASVLLVYDEGSSSGWFGAAAQKKYETQYVEGYGPFGILLSGRTEFLVSFDAISDSPLIGHGSWAKNDKYTDLYIAYKKKFMPDYKYDYTNENLSGVIPSHSHVFGAWVESGVLGAVFWIYVSLLFIKLIEYWDYIAWRLQPVLMFLVVWSIWDIVFSPFGGERRLYWGVVLALLIFLLEKTKQYTCVKSPIVDKGI